MIQHTTTMAPCKSRVGAPASTPCIARCRSLDLNYDADNAADENTNTAQLPSIIAQLRLENVKLQKSNAALKAENEILMDDNINLSLDERSYQLTIDELERNLMWIRRSNVPDAKEMSNTILELQSKIGYYQSTIVEYQDGQKRAERKIVNLQQGLQSLKTRHKQRERITRLKMAKLQQQVASLTKTKTALETECCQLRLSSTKNADNGATNELGKTTEQDQLAQVSGTQCQDNIMHAFCMRQSESIVTHELLFGLNES